MISDTPTQPQVIAPAARAWWRRLPIGLAIVLVAAALSALPGLERRSFTGDEFGSLGHNVPHMLERSINIDEPDDWSAHLPLAWMLRYGFHGLFGDERIVVWRLHACLGVFLAALFSWWVVHRRGTPWRAVAVGLLVGLHPILSFHGRDSTNYVLAPFTGVVLLAGLAAIGNSRRSAYWLLPLGLLLGASNDFYFAFPALAALVITPWLVRASPERVRSRRAAFVAWSVTFGALVLPALLVLRRARNTTMSLMVERHADPDAMRTWSRTAGEAFEFCSAYLGGYRVTGDPTFSVAGLALLVGCVIVALASKDAHARAAGGLLVVGVIGMLVVDWSFGQVLWDDRVLGSTYRGFPAQPRAYLAFLPALALVWVDGLATCGRRVGPILVCGLIFVVALATAQDVSSVQDGQAWAVETIEERWEEGDLVATVLPISMRLSPSIPYVKDLRLPADHPSPRRVWVVSFAGGPGPSEVTSCEEPDRRLIDHGYRLRHSEYRFLPPHDFATNSYLPFATWLFLLERSEAPSPPAEPRRWRLRFEPSVLSGVATVNANGEGYEFASEVPLRELTGRLEELSVTLLPRSVPLPDWPVLRELTAPIQNHLASYPYMVVPADPIEPVLRMRVESFTAPSLKVPRRLAVVVLGLVGPALPLLLLLRRRRKSGGVAEESEPHDPPLS